MPESTARATEYMASTDPRVGSTNSQQKDVPTQQDMSY